MPEMTDSIGRSERRFSKIALFALLLTGPSVAEPVGTLQKGHTQDIIQVLWSDDSTRLLSYSAGDSEIRVWDVPNARMLWRTKTDPPENSVAGAPAPTSFAWAPNGVSIAVGWSTGLVQLRNARNGDLMAKGRVKGEITAVAFSLTSDELAVALEAKHGSGKVEVFATTASFRPIRTYRAIGRIVSFQFSDDGISASAGTMEGIWLRWSGRSDTPEQKKLSMCSAMPDSEGGIATVAYGLRTHRAAVRCGTSTRVVDLDTGSVALSRPSETYEKAVRFSSDGNDLAIEGSDEIAVVNLSTKAEHLIKSRSRTGTTFDLSRDGSLLAEGGSYGDPGVFITSVGNSASLPALRGHPGIVYDLACSPDFTSCAAAGGDGKLYLLDPRIGSQIAALGGHQLPVKSVRYDPSGRLLISGDEDGTATIWQVHSGVELHRLGLLSAGAELVAISPRGDHIATLGGISDNEIHIWAAGDGALIRSLGVADMCGLPPSLEPCSVKPRSIEFISQGTVLANGGNGRIYLVDIETGHVERIAVDVHLGPVIAIASTLGIIGGERQPALVFDLTSRRVRRTLGKESQYSTALAISADGTLAATGSIIGRIVVWDISTGRILRQYRCSREIQGLAFSPDGRTLLAGGADQTVRAWDLSHDQMLFDLLVGEQ
jgi:WD40 repeat protein